MSITFKIFLLFSVGIVVYKASEVLISSIKSLSKDGLLGKFFLASLFAGIATSLPEVFVALSASYEGYPSLSIGNALGSNIVNLGFVVPLAIFLAGKGIDVKKESFNLRNILLVLSATVFPFMLVLDRVLSFYDGLFLIAMFFIYVFYIFEKKEGHGFLSILGRIKKTFLHPDFWKGMVGIIASLLILVLGSDIMVKLTLSIGEELNITPFLSGLVFVALATSLPELFVATSAIAKGESTIFFGDILGSLVTNANLVIALSTLAKPVVFLDLSDYAISTVFLFIIMALFYVFALTKRRIEKWEAVVLLACYVLFLILEKII